MLLVDRFKKKKLFLIYALLSGLSRSSNVQVKFEEKQSDKIPKVTKVGARVGFAPTIPPPCLERLIVVFCLLPQYSEITT